MYVTTQPFSQSWHFLFKALHKPIAGICLSIGLVISGLATLPGLSLEQPAEMAQTEQATASPMVASRDAQAQDVTGRSPALEDGVYLYGQAAEPDQLGSAYLVFEVTDNQVVGAFYMPHSSFDCFQGEFQANRLALEITDSYEQVTYPFSIALNQDTAIATADGSAATSVGLAGFNRLETVSENDQRILGVCQADLGTEI